MRVRSGGFVYQGDERSCVLGVAVLCAREVSGHVC